MVASASLDIVIIGLTITSSWGNGHAVTYRALVPALARRGHRICFLERDMPWYAQNRDVTSSTSCQIHLYTSTAELKERFAARIRSADVVIVGSYVPDGIEIGNWVTHTATGLTAFYDIDTPVTIAALSRGRCEYLCTELMSRYNLYLSFTGGPFLARIKQEFGIPEVMALYCSADPDLYQPSEADRQYDLGYMGTYSPDRQPSLERLMIQAARHWPIHCGRAAVPGSDPVACQHPPHRAPGSRTSPRILHVSKLYPQPDPQRHDPNRFFTQCPAF